MLKKRGLKMKKMKSAFTLAEVLITLGIIGIIAAIILPSVMSNYQYKSVGVKLAKFLSTTEGAARAWAVNEGNFAARPAGAADDEDGVADFLNDTFIFKRFDPEINAEAEGGVRIQEYPSPIVDRTLEVAYEPIAETQASPFGILKDGTGIQVFYDDTEYQGDHEELVAVEKYGAPVFRIRFSPNVQGLPNTAVNVYDFSVTELGYVFPHENDLCTWELFNNDFSVTSRVFQPGRACHTETARGGDGD